MANIKNKKKDPERVLINVNTMNLFNDLSDLSQIAEEANKLAESFGELGLGTLTPELLTDALMNDGRRIEAMRDKQISEDLKRFSNPQIAAGLRSSAEVWSHSFFRKCERMKGVCGLGRLTALLPFVAQSEDGRFVPDKDAETKLTEKHSYYISDPKEIEIHAAHVKAAEAVDKLIKMMHGFLPERFATLFREKGGRIETCPVAYSYFTGGKNNEDDGQE